MTGTLEPSGLVRVAVPADFFDFVAIESVGEFLAEYPKVRLDFVLSDAKADLITEQIDVAFRAGPMRDSGYIGRQVLCDDYDCFVASPAYIAARGAPATLQDLMTHDCVSFASPGNVTTWSLAGVDGIAEEVRVVPRMSGNTIQALRKASLAGIGITLMPQLLVKRDFHAGLLVPILPQYKRTRKGMHVLYPSKRHLPLAVSIFIELVVQKLREL